MLISTPWAPSMDRSSSSGLEIAARAASTARSSPRAVPVPISATPISFMIVRTSAKSRLMSPWIVMRSEIPRTALKRTSSASLKASCTAVFLPASASSRWLGMVITVSTTRCSSSRPCSACFMRTRPSKRKGLVTTPTVRAPTSRATSARTGAAPVPVPPPSPAVTNTMSVPSSSSRIRSRTSSAAPRPLSGSAPQPRPRVISPPSWILFGARLCWSACASVFAAMNSTPWRPDSIMLLSALPPPPPTPITLIEARWFDAFSNSSSSRPPSSPALRRSRSSCSARVRSEPDRVRLDISHPPARSHPRKM